MAAHAVATYARPDVERFAGGYSGCHTLVVAGIAHMSNMERPAEFNATPASVG
jgi:hypothetical protein